MQNFDMDWIGSSDGYDNQSVDVLMLKVLILTAARVQFQPWTGGGHRQLHILFQTSAVRRYRGKRFKTTAHKSYEENK